MFNLPTLDEILNALAFLGQERTALAVLGTALVLVTLRDWRWSLLALAGQYMLAGWLLTDRLEPEVAILQSLVGLMVCLVLYVTARQVNWGVRERQIATGPPVQGGQASTSPTKRTGRIKIAVLRTNLVFRLLAGSLTAAIVLHATRSGIIALPELPAHMNVAAVGLMALGLLALGLTEEPLSAGMGLLTAMTGFTLFYHSLQQAITVIGFLIGIEFLIALVIAYLTVAHHLTPEQARRRRRL
jgi:hypothetical protein